MRIRTETSAQFPPGVPLLSPRVLALLAILQVTSVRDLGAAEQALYPIKDGKAAAECRFDGPIASADISALRSNANSGCKTLFLSSPGGDLRTALILGRIIRKAEMYVVVPETGRCASACVLMYAGGVLRVPYGPVLIHRPYPSQAPKSFGDTQREFSAIGQEVKRYLRDVNVSDTLFDRMLTIPPEDAVALTLDEMDEIGLGGLDAVYAEYVESRKAARFGFTRQEWLKKKQSTIAVCGPVTGVPVPAEEVPSRRNCWDRLFPEYFAPRK